VGTGGARYGAGRPGWRRKCESMLRLDVRRLSRKGVLHPGSYVSLGWTRDGEQYANIGIYSSESSVRLSYSCTRDDEPRNMHYDVSITRTLCRLGGSRPWFLCPRCWRRCAVLYGLARDGRFGCRVCLRLAYASEAESPIDRCWRQQRKIEAKLTDDGERPRGMRRRTFERLCARWEAVEERKDELWLPGFERLARRLGFDPGQMFD
jgi:hypothetical protein